LIDENLARERVEIETIFVGLRIDAVPNILQEGDTTIVPVVEEILVVERRLILKEEIRIKRVRGQNIIRRRSRFVIKRLS
jgi:hypothetical protein